MSTWQQARNILVVRLDNAGDVIMLGPALRAIKEHSPEARITLLASPAGAAAAPLLPWIDRVMVHRAIWQQLGNHPLQPEREQRLIAELAEQQFDAALIFTSFSQTPHVAGYACYMAGIPLRAGESKEFGGACLTTSHTPAPDDLHQTERNLRLVETLGFTTQTRRLHIHLSAAARDDAQRLLRGVQINLERPFVLLHPGASAQARRYPAHRLGEVAQLLQGEGVQVVIGGGERDRPLVGEVLEIAPHVPVLCGKADLGTFAALIEAAAVVVCGNTLPLHLSEALDTPVVALYSGTDLESQWRPQETAHTVLRRPTTCYPCYLITCPIGRMCLDIPPSRIAQAVRRLVGLRIQDTGYRM